MTGKNRQRQPHQQPLPSPKNHRLPTVHRQLIEQSDKSGAKRGRATLLVAGLALAGVVLMALYVYSNSATLSLNQKYRPLLSQFCNISGCRINELSDQQQLILSDLRVQPDPRRNDQLKVDLLMENRATYQQRFPVLQLSFYTIDGQMLARREYKPAEYLRGELKGHIFMPAQRQIHVQVQIENPGADAVNYRVQIR